MNDKELWELISITSEGQDSEQRRKVEQYITDLQKEIDRLGKLFYERNEENIRLNNIIKEVRKALEKSIEEYKLCDCYETAHALEIVKCALQELKGSDKE